MLYKVTPEIRACVFRVNHLDKALPDVMRPMRWWERSFRMSDRVMFLEALADARCTLSLAVERRYPVLLGRGYTVTIDTIECPEIPLSVDAVDPSAGIQESGPRATEESTAATRLPSPEEPER